MITANVNEASREQLIAWVEQLQRKPVSRLTLKVSEKGALSVYGMGKWPVTLYRGQWERLMQAIPDIEAFIKANEATLSVKA